MWAIVGNLISLAIAGLFIWLMIKNHYHKKKHKRYFEYPKRRRGIV